MSRSFGFYAMRVLLVLMVAAIAGLIAYYSTRGAETAYESTAKVLVDQPQVVGLPAGSANIVKIQALIPTYAEIVMSQATAEKVADVLTDFTPQEILSTLNASNVEKTQILVITARTADPNESMEIAATTTKVFIDWVTNQQNVDKVKTEDRLQLTIVDPAITVREITPQRQRTVILSAVAALIVAFGAVLVFENARRV